MGRDADDQPDSLWSFAEWQKIRGEALTASAAIESAPDIDARAGAIRAREALYILRSHKPYEGKARRSRGHTAAPERQEATG